MIDEKKLISELEKWLNDTAYLKEKYSGSVQIKDSVGDNFIYTNAEIAYDAISAVIDKINEQEKTSDWIPVSKRLPEYARAAFVTHKRSKTITEAFYSKYLDKWYSIPDGESIDVTAWMDKPEPYKHE